LPASRWRMGYRKLRPIGLQSIKAARNGRFFHARKAIFSFASNTIAASTWT
jgi:hypothetical protein